MTRLLGVDLGTRRIGLAVGDSVSGSAVPLATIRRADPERDARTIGRIVQEQRVDELVVGLPLNMDGSEGFQAAATREWALAVADTAAVPIAWRDERLTTERAIERTTGPGRGSSGGPPSAHRRTAYRARLDQLAAAAIVQAELDARAAASEARRTPSESAPTNDRQPK